MIMDSRYSKELGISASLDCLKSLFLVLRSYSVEWDGKITPNDE